MTAVDQAWNRVFAAADRLQPQHLRMLFAADAGRFERFSAGLDDLLIDFSKEKIDADALAALLDLADIARVEARRDAMFAGEAVNVSEDRPALHTALRGGGGDRVMVGGHDVMPDVRANVERFLGFAEDVRTGRYRTASGAAFTDVINIGIGGSDLGPAMAVRALAPWHDGPRVHFVSNIDAAHLTETIAGLDPAQTLVIVASKSFTTLETMTNARSARAWLEDAVGPGAADHFAAVSSSPEATRAFGIDDSRSFRVWDWVGGRYSIWSAVGLPLAIAIGAEKFRDFLAGACAMDAHFRSAPLAENLPVLLALVGIWRRNAMGWPTVALAPYDQRLAGLPAFVQQLDMESNGKHVQRDGAPVALATGPVIWGQPGTNAQHSFFQLLHQGTDIIPVDFLLAAEPNEDLGDHHAKLAANALAQSATLAFGLTEAEVEGLAPHRVLPGDRPSTTILYRRLDPFGLGRLIALFEHKIFVQGVIWNVNSFDQWGVEHGKAMATQLLPTIEGGSVPDTADGSTTGLLAHFRSLQAGPRKT